MLSKTLQKALNEQIQKEFYSSYLYLSMAAYTESMNLPGFAHWLKLQQKEEMGHAMQLYKYINERGGRVELLAIDQPTSEFKSPTALFEEVLKHEQSITESINKLYEKALKENDYATQVMLQSFISEQVEEEATASEILETLKMAGEKGQALLMLDRQLARRGMN
ncbi:MAG: ferritin [Prosthecochloris sp.]|uniref:Ferritin n=1 Tax=Prosthecochloris aestuarii (strain DSM 271 / SK 413) TaxID=290512 RepID=B4S5L5_PROA2|nr:MULTISPECIES: ferritin [Prosthecochloris]ACF45612.1 Ferroxidase [Prosthecochloris aestuarii DSM 271]MCW8797527.1 ferritin [Prosthecochloris sp.]NEX11605.1 ferritin [Prosthecochloris sp.]RDD30866.1 ferritin [Prosthecochloris sp. ZM]